jgi:hypothetical protein
MRGSALQNFDGYSDEAIQSVLDDAPGKFVKNGPEGGVIGKVISAERIRNTNIVMFELEIEEDSL